MPASYVRKTVAPLHERLGIFGPVRAESSQGQALIDAVAPAYQVSRDAARVRLSVMNLLGTPTGQSALFS
jgi:hypothetical protein